MFNHQYGFFDQLLHRLALQYRLIAEMSFDLDQSLVKTNPAEISLQRHVFVSGLARAGTTALMRRIHETELFRSLTYKDMPFVLAPNLWSKLTSLSRREIENVERAHGDKFLVNLDSPESLDEVFWRSFAGNEYIERDKLKSHSPSEDLTSKYVCYVNAILSNHSPCKRYLSKNNNNILRLGAIQRAFPNSLILIPFRNPFQQSYSLLRQHRHFTRLQTRSKFVLSYMSWLGHHEFGLDHRRFVLTYSKGPEYAIDTLDYWLQLWCEVYSWLKNTKPSSAFFVCYEDICANEDYWRKLAMLAEIPADHKAGSEFQESSRSVSEPMDKELVGLASEIYESLTTLSRSALPS
ncbi:MAG: sulfotransferase [Deltaproteobacteria bacterium]